MVWNRRVMRRGCADVVASCLGDHTVAHLNHGHHAAPKLAHRGVCKIPSKFPKAHWMHGGALHAVAGLRECVGALCAIEQHRGVCGVAALEQHGARGQRRRDLAAEVSACRHLPCASGLGSACAAPQRAVRCCTARQTSRSS